MPPIRPDIAEIRRAHTAAMGKKWTAAVADMENIKNTLLTNINKEIPPAVDVLDLGFTEPVRLKLKGECDKLESDSLQMLAYARSSEAKVGGTAGAGTSVPPADPSFNKLKDWLASADPTDLPSFPQCFTFLEQLVETYVFFGRLCINPVAVQSGEYESHGTAHPPHQGPQGAKS